MVTHACNPSTRDMRVGESIVQGYIQGQPRQHETLCYFFKRINIIITIKEASLSFLVLTPLSALFPVPCILGKHDGSLAGCSYLNGRQITSTWPTLCIFTIKDCQLSDKGDEAQQVKWCSQIECGTEGIQIQFCRDVDLGLSPLSSPE